MSTNEPNTSPNYDEGQWVKQIQLTIDEEHEENEEFPVTIFGVPKLLLLTDQDSYIPQQVAIGPYHHLRPELYDMERYKLAAAKRWHKTFQGCNLHKLVEKLIKSELRIRAAYHRPLRFAGDTLAWMMAVDASFLLEFLQVSAINEGKVLTRIPSKVMAHLIDISGNRMAHNCILRDIMMLENQIPLFVLRYHLEAQYSSLSMADEMLSSMLTGVSKELCPIKKVEKSQNLELKNCAHLLDFLYHYIVPKIEDPSETIEIHEEEGDEEVAEKEIEEVRSLLRHFLDKAWNILSKFEQGPVQRIKNLIFSKPVTLMVKLPWTLLSKIPILKMLKEPLENVFNSAVKGKKDDDAGGESGSNHPLLEEITIPSVFQLSKVGVQFMPTNEGITSIHFDEKTLTFYIPKMTLDINSEVILRNLVAYEAGSVSGPLVLARYTELMNGIIDTEVDVKFLCQKGIIVNHLKSEAEVANTWNGMSKSVRLTKVPALDKVISDVNKFYNGRWKVKIETFLKVYVFGSWKILTFLGGIILLLFMSLQAFCQVYRCGRIFHIEGFDPLAGGDD